MSVVVARLNDKTDLWEFASDSIACQDRRKIPEKNGKMFVFYKGLTIGFVGDWRAAQIMMTAPVNVTLLQNLNSCSPLEAKNFLMNDFAKYLASLSLIYPKGFKRLTMLISLRGRLFRMYGEDLQVLEPTENYDAIGCGADIALGALYAGASAEQAVKAACHFHTEVSEPIHKLIAEV